MKKENALLWTLFGFFSFFFFFLRLDSDLANSKAMSLLLVSSHGRCQCPPSLQHILSNFCFDRKKKTVHFVCFLLLLLFCLFHEWLVYFSQSVDEKHNVCFLYASSQLHFPLFVLHCLWFRIVQRIGGILTLQKKSSVPLLSPCVRLFFCSCFTIIYVEGFGHI